MSDTTDQPEMGNPPADAPETGADAPTDAGTVDRAEFERTKKALKEANREAAERRKRLDELEKAEAERQAATLSDTQKLEKAQKAAEERAAAAERELTKIKREREIGREARKMGIFDDEALDDLPTFVPDDLDLDDPKAVRTALETVGKQKKYLLKKSAAEGADINAGNRGSSRSGGGMTPEEVAAYKQRYGIK